VYSHEMLFGDQKGSGKAILSTIIEDLIKKMSKIWILVFHHNFDPPLQICALATVIGA